MIFTETALNGAFVIDPEPVSDERGRFMRTWCQREFEAYGLVARWVQTSASMNTRRGTLRGLHYQAAPNEEVKLVRCIAGSIFDVVVDLRPMSPTYCQYVSIILSAENGRAVYIPKQCAHGFLTLEENSEVSYCMSEFYSPNAVRGFRWDDPAFKIAWPEPIHVMSNKDRAWSGFIKDSA